MHQRESFPRPGHPAWAMVAERWVSKARKGQVSPQHRLLLSARSTLPKSLVLSVLQLPWSSSSAFTQKALIADKLNQECDWVQAGSDYNKNRGGDDDAADSDDFIKRMQVGKCRLHEGFISQLGDLENVNLGEHLRLNAVCVCVCVGVSCWGL